MSLQDRLPALLEDPTPRQGVVQRWLDTLTEEDRNLTLKYMSMSQSELSTLSLLQALRDEGAPFGKEALRAYRYDLWKSNVSK